MEHQKHEEWRIFYFKLWIPYVRRAFGYEGTAPLNHLSTHFDYLHEILLSISEDMEYRT